MSSRREFLKTSAWATGAAVAMSACATAPANPVNPALSKMVNGEALKGPVYDLLTNPEHNKEVYAKMQGDLDFTQDRSGWYTGYVYAVRDGHKNVDLVGFAGLSHARLFPQPDGTYRKVLREVGLYTDLKSGEVLEEWDNPLNNERVKVVPVANDPFNQELAPYFDLPPSYGGLNEEEVASLAPKRVPIILPWQQRGEQVHMERHIHLYYPAALQPDEWPRESPGKFNRVSEMFSHYINAADIQNADSTKLLYNGHWTRVTPWLPWMLMGQTQGHCEYQCYMGGGQDLEQMLPRNILDYIEKHYNKYLTAPGAEAWEQDSLSSIERYALEQTPAPVK